MDPEPDDLALLAAWRTGDRVRGSQLFARHARAVTRFFRSKVPEAAEDLAQNTFLALVELEPDRLRDHQLRAYLFGIARNQLLLYLRGKTRAAARFDPLLASVRDAGAGPAKLIARDQQHRVIAEALQRLPVDYQTAIELHYFENLSIAEIAVALERPVGTIKSLLSRGRTLLRDELTAIVTTNELLTSVVGELDRWMSSLPAVLDDPELRDQAD